MAEGNTVLVDFWAIWCPTCKVQQRRLKTLREENAAYDENMVFVKLDWDAYGNSDLSIKHNIPRRSTLLLLRGEEELGRIIAGTKLETIRDLLDLGLVNT